MIEARVIVHPAPADVQSNMTRMDMYNAIQPR